MPEARLHQQLLELHRLILAERDSAQRLDMAGLQQAVEQKSALLANLPEPGNLDADDATRELAALIRRENRRNAYLFWSSLNWVRETVGFYSSQLTSKSYSQAGAAIQTSKGGALLSGKI